MGTRLARPGLIRLALLATLGMVVLPACATMTAYKQEVAAYQALADQATEHFHKGHVSITLTDNTKGWYSRPDHSIQLGVRNGYNRSLPLLAHELGHHILNHDQQSSALEMEANAMGVEVLQVWGWSFYQAFDMLGDMLCRARGSNTVGHLSRAEEIKALKAHYADRNVEGFHCWNEKAATAPVLLAQFGSLP